MTRADSLRVLVYAETPDTIDGIELLVREILDRIDAVPESHSHRPVANRRVVELLLARERLLLADTLPEWLFNRYACEQVDGWNDLMPSQRAWWAQEAAHVRRAVAGLPR